MRCAIRGLGVCVVVSCCVVVNFCFRLVGVFCGGLEVL